MSVLRFKVLAAGFLVTTGLTLSLGGAWQSSATAQGPGVGKGPPAFRNEPPKANPTIEKLRADLEQAQAELAKAEAEAKLRAAAEDERARVRYLALEVPHPKYDYEPVPKAGFSKKDFEVKLAERAKEGWTYLGTNPIQDKDGAAVPTMVFRSTPISDVLKPVDPAAPKVAPLPPSGTPKPQPKKDDSEALFDSPRQAQIRIAELEKLVAELRLEKRPLRLEKRPLGEKVEDESIAIFTAKDYGKWDAKDLLPVLAKLMADDANTNDWKLLISLGTDGVIVKGSPAAIACAINWMKLLKK